MEMETAPFNFLSELLTNLATGEIIWLYNSLSASASGTIPIQVINESWLYLALILFKKSNVVRDSLIMSDFTGGDRGLKWPPPKLEIRR